MHFPLSFTPTPQVSIVLPTSKSISARALILRALSLSPCSLRGISDCDDTQVLRRALRNRARKIDVGASGTAMRFLTAYWSTQVGEEHVLTGTARMQQRPIRLLVEALRTLGADIEYLGQEGYPPLRIRGRQLQGGDLSIPASTSSQYISALLMIAPTLTDGIELTLEGEIASQPYIEMTLGLMYEWGVRAQWEGQTIRVPSAAYRREELFRIEPDWSAASYWYSLLALCPSPEASVVLPGLEFASWQGDSYCAHLFQALGIHSMFAGNRLVLSKMEQDISGVLQIDFTHTPDLAQTLVVCCVMLGQAFHFKGLQSLKIKETDRIAALITEVGKFGHCLTEPAEGQLAFDPRESMPLPTDTPIAIATYEDHRMAMAFAPAAYRYSHLTILHPEVVSKSYPRFWDDLAKIAIIHRP